MDSRSERKFEQTKAPILEETAKRYGIAPSAFRKHGSFESFVYEFERNGAAYILKLTHSIHRTPEMVESEIDWVMYLAGHGSPVCRPVPSVAGRLVEVIDGRSVKELAGDYFIVYAFEKADGRRTRRDDWTDEFITLWGRTLGAMHSATKKYTPSDGIIERFHWYDDPAWEIQKYPPNDEEIAEKWGEIHRRLGSFPVDADGYGLIHSDMHHGNFVADGGRIRVFDFDDCHYAWLAFDITIPLFYVLRDAAIDPDDVEYARRFFDRFLTGYIGQNTLDGNWIKRIPDFMKLREMDLYTIIMAESAADADDWCRRFMAGRRDRIVHDIPVTELDFVEFA